MYDSFVPWISHDTLELIQSNIDVFKNNTPEQYNELLGISTYLEYDFVTTVAINYAEELAVHCSSIVARNKLGKPMLCRNLDFSNSEHLRNVIFKANFVGLNDLRFEGIMIGGLIGIHTGSKNHAFSISLNAKSHKRLP